MGICWGGVTVKWLSRKPLLAPFRCLCSCSPPVQAGLLSHRNNDLQSYHCTTHHNHLDFAGPLTWLYPSRDPPYLNLPPCYRTNICLCSSRSFSLRFHIPIPFSCSKARVRHFVLSCITVVCIKKFRWTFHEILFASDCQDQGYDLFVAHHSILLSLGTQKHGQTLFWKVSPELFYANDCSCGGSNSIGFILALNQFLS